MTAIDPTKATAKDMKIKTLGWNQDVVLGSACNGHMIGCDLEGYGSNYVDTQGRYCWARRTVESLLRAGFLHEIGDNTFAVTPLGRRAFEILPRKSN